MRLLAFALAGAAIGVAVGVGVAAASGKTYRADAVLQALPAGETALEPGRKLVLETQAETYAALLEERSFLEQIRPQVAAGKLSTEELLERVSADHAPGTALLEVHTTSGSQADARALASDVVGALLGYVQQSARQRSAAVEDELRRQIEELNAQIASASNRPARLEELRERRARLTEELARVPGTAVQEATRIVVAGAPVIDPDPIAASLPLWGAVGGVCGLVLGLIAALVAPRRMPRPAPVPTPAPEATPAVVEPRAGAILTGPVAVRAEPAGRRIEWSRDGAAWTAVDGAEWPPADVPDGRYLLRAEGSDVAIPVEVDRTPPAVELVEPEPNASVRGTVMLRAVAVDNATGVAAVEFMLSDGGPDWQTIATAPPGEQEAEWNADGVAPGLYWLVAVARDRAGLPAATEPRAVRVTS